MRKFANLGKNYDEDEEDFELEEDNKDFNFTSLLNKDAAKNRNVYLWGDVDEDTAISVISQLHYFSNQNTNPIRLIIHSSGGELDAGLAIMDEIRAVQNYGIVVSTVATGKAYSAAAIILTMGSLGYRFARPNASIMLHPVSYGFSHDYADYQEKISHFLKLKNKSVVDMMAKQTGLKTDKQVKQLISDMDKGLWLTPEEAVTRKIIDGILDVPLIRNGTIKNGTKKRNTGRNKNSV